MTPIVFILSIRGGIVCRIDRKKACYQSPNLSSNIAGFWLTSLENQ